jgi:tryptophanyl-tRNA synthetase
VGAIRARAEALAATPEKVDAILAEGAQKARAVAQKTMAEIRTRLGLFGA